MSDIVERLLRQNPQRPVTDLIEAAELIVLLRNVLSEGIDEIASLRTRIDHVTIPRAQYDALQAAMEAAKVHLRWINSDRAGPDYGGLKRDTHPNGEAIWRQWWELQMELCSETEWLCRAALRAAGIENGETKT